MTSTNADLSQQIAATIQSHDVVVFMKGTTQAPMCGFSGLVVQVFNHLGVAFHDVNVMADPGLREEIKVYSNWPTIPQIYVKGEFMGGCDIIKELFQSGELRPLLEAKGISVAPPA